MALVSLSTWFSWCPFQVVWLVLFFPTRFSPDEDLKEFMIVPDKEGILYGEEHVVFPTLLPLKRVCRKLAVITALEQDDVVTKALLEAKPWHQLQRAAYRKIFKALSGQVTGNRGRGRGRAARGRGGRGHAPSIDDADPDAVRSSDDEEPASGSAEEDGWMPWEERVQASNVAHRPDESGADTAGTDGPRGGSAAASSPAPPPPPAGAHPPGRGRQGRGRGQRGPRPDRSDSQWGPFKFFTVHPGGELRILSAQCPLHVHPTLKCRTNCTLDLSLPIDEAMTVAKRKLQRWGVLGFEWDRSDPLGQWNHVHKTPKANTLLSLSRAQIDRVPAGMFGQRELEALM